MKAVYLAVTTVVAVTLSLVSPGVVHAADNAVTVGNQTHTLSGTDVYRATDFLVRYTPNAGSRTGTNSYGFEAAVVNGTVTAIENGVGNMAIPANGFVLSGHGEARSWLKAQAVVGASVSFDGAPPPPASWVKVGDLTRELSGTDVYRAANFLVRYTPLSGARTGTNAYGFEAAVVNGKVTAVEDLVGNMMIPPNGYVLSGHGAARGWLRANAVPGAAVTLSGSEPPPTTSPKLPDIGVRTLRQFFIANAGGAKLLKFPAVTANVGNGPMEIRATRSSSTSSDWVGKQVVHNTDGSTTTLPATGAIFYFAGDGHSHWHIRDFDSYQLFDSSGTELKRGEKHGFCFEDNTTYRDWVGSPRHPEVPVSPVYTHEGSCGEGLPAATSIVHGLSVGWSDTYPSSLPDQAIDITGLPDGIYVVRVTADWQHFWEETNEANNTASAQIRIAGNTVTLLSATDGL